MQKNIPPFLDQIIKTLRLEQTAQPMQSRTVSGPSGGNGSALSEVGTTARRHGHELSQRGYTVDLVVHDYGDLCQSITDLAFEENAPIEVDEFRTLNRCLDIPPFLDQIIKTLRLEQTAEPMQSRTVSGPSGGNGSALSEIGTTARRHGHELSQRGYTVDLVVHDYRDLCPVYYRSGVRGECANRGG